MLPKGPVPHRERAEAQGDLSGLSRVAKLEAWAQSALMPIHDVFRSMML